MVAIVLTLVQTETVRLDAERLGALYRQLGEVAAEDVVCRAIEELALRLSHCERLWRQGDRPGLAKTARSLIAISEQIGMTALARTARNVADAAVRDDTAAQGATMYRLLRIGECSLTEVWDIQDQSV